MLILPGTQFRAKTVLANTFGFTGIGQKKYTVYKDNEAGTTLAGGQSQINYMVFRYADVLLVYAEAQNEAAGPDALATLADAAQIPAPARTDGVSLLPSLTGKGQQKDGLVYIEYENNGVIPNFDEFSPSHRARKRNQMQKIRLGDYVGVRYDIKSASDDFEIYDVVKDPQERKNLGQQATCRAMQKTLKEKVTQVRRPDPEAPRPYVAAVDDLKGAPGIRWATYEGQFPWPADLSDRPTTQTGIKASTDLTDVKLKEGMIYYEGYLKIPRDGMYQFSMSSNGSYVVLLHESLLLDRNYPDRTSLKLPLSATVNLKAGEHPFRIYYHQAASQGKPSLDWTWQSDGIVE